MRKIKPMLATLVSEPFDDPAWLFEPKWDGFRAIADVENHKPVLYSRNLNDFTHFGEINEALKKLPLSAVLDGEIVVEDARGRAHFQLLQNYQKNGAGKLVYYVFDLLFLKHRDLRRLPLVERKKLLKKLLSGVSKTHVRVSPDRDRHGVRLFKQAVKKGWEGIIAKRKDGPYLSGKRTRFWLKIKTHLRQEAVIIGFTEPTGSRRYFGSLLLGVYERGRLKFVGHTGSGFDEATLKLLHAKMKPLVTKASAFSITPKSRTKAYWIKPRLVCEVSFAEWTADGKMRQAIFMGLRSDKQPKKVHREYPK